MGQRSGKGQETSRKLFRSSLKTFEDSISNSKGLVCRLNKLKGLLSLKRRRPEKKLWNLLRIMSLSLNQNRRRSK